MMQHTVCYPFYSCVLRTEKNRLTQRTMQTECNTEGAMYDGCTPLQYQQLLVREYFALREQLRFEEGRLQQLNRVTLLVINRL